ncbi:crossover junction endodeoxyribonuclease RuvC [Kamptonema cortianum]|nr:crossover junction endodeoxyribonuclease RuvC [Geitlerinema splendidum]MDK3161149.1 crossover junction endodeoxyribonuclease RuvC [Kamptonema cortianum]
MRVLGIDPGLERVGWGVIDRDGSRLIHVAHGLISSKPGDLGGRLQQIHRETGELIEIYQPDRVAVERLLFTKNVTTAMDVAKAFGCILLAVADAGLSVQELSPPEVKKAVVGTGRAEKKQMQFMVTKLLNLSQTPKPDDVADALGVALAGLLVSPSVLNLERRG